VNNRAKNTDQRVAPQPADFPSDEALQSVIQLNVTGRDQHYGRSRMHTARSNQLSETIEAKGRALEALRQEIADLTHDKNQNDHYAKQEWDTYQAYEMTLNRIGAKVPPPADPQSAPLPVSQGDAGAHAAQWGNLSDPSPTGRAYESPQPIGKCSGCGEPLWQGATGPVHAYGGADCFPEREDTPTAQVAEPVQ